MTAYILDTNVASHIIKGDRPELQSRLIAVPMEDIAISAVTEAELFYGLAKRGYPSSLTERVRQFLLRVEVLPWDHDVTRAYGDLRAKCESIGVILSPLDMMIAAHAVATGATLVTRDRAFSNVPKPLNVEDWALPVGS
ncbi:MAG TPA: type II toxin-antitoxin system VapC family toxin [Allosphingosinicella sp.]|nr:type II toxin-antitoxin system VapC family toxin [Allosphingosinicella sp.]